MTLPHCSSCKGKGYHVEERNSGNVYTDCWVCGGDGKGGPVIFPNLPQPKEEPPNA